jgi:hypothetical protein
VLTSAAILPTLPAADPKDLEKETRPTRSEASVFLRGLLIRALLLALLTAGLNLLVNPFGNYATRFFDPIILSTRRPKLFLYDQRRPAPEIVLFGSSRSFAMEPAYLEARTSRGAFNAAFHAASTGDYLNLARCLAHGRAFPRLLVVGLGVEQMLAEAQPVERHDPVARCASPGEPSILATLWDYRGLLTTEESWASVRLLALEFRGRPAPRYTFAADGMVIGSETRPLEQAVDESLAGNWRPSMFDADGLRPGNLGQVQQLLELSRDRGARVIVYLPPYHPRAMARYESESRFPALRRLLLERLASWAQQYPLRIYDFTDVGRFGGHERMFYDASHPTSEAFRLMVDVMLADLV